MEENNLKILLALYIRLEFRIFFHFPHMIISKRPLTIASISTELFAVSTVDNWSITTSAKEFTPISFQMLYSNMVEET